MNRQYGECSKCGKWGYAPPEFKESLHFLKCMECNVPMYLISIGEPKEVGHSDRDMVAVGIMRQS